MLDRLRRACNEVTVGHAERAEASRDWWPLAMIWALEGQVPALASCVCRPAHAGEVAAVLSVCNEARVPVTAAGGRSGVCGASVPVHGGVVLDLTAMAGVTDVDDASLVVSVLPGTFGHELEAELRGEHGLTLGHWPQSVELSTVGGWVACRSAGQYSTRYGKIEDMVVGLDVVLADGRTITTGGMPRQAVGPDLTQLFVGSEGTLGVITGARLRAHPVPPDERRAAYGFDSFAGGLDACRRILRRGATPAVLRLYDEAESKRSYGTEGTNVLLVLDEGEPALVDATMAIVAQECRQTASARRRPRRAVAGPPQRRERAGGPHPEGLRGRHHGDLGPVVTPRRHLHGGDGGAAGRPRMPGGHRPPEPQLSRRCLPLLHLRGPAGTPRIARPPTSSSGRRAPVPSSRPVARSATITASVCTGRGSSERHWATPSRCSPR